MAVSTNPLQRETVQVQSHDTGAAFAAPATNGALELARSLAAITPEANQALQGYAQDKAKKLATQARFDALNNSGQVLADAVRDGKIEPTQNPWYNDAYNRESAAIRAQADFTKLQTESASWAEQSDPAAFAKRWHEEAGAIGQNYATSKESQEGYLPVADQFTQQALQSNVAQSIQRTKVDRVNNLGALAADSLQRALAANGGTLTPNQARDALAPTASQWFNTGGDNEGWAKIAYSAIDTAGKVNPQLYDLTHAPEIIGGGGKDPESDIPVGSGPHAASLNPNPIPGVLGQSGVIQGPQDAAALGYESAKVSPQERARWDKRADGSAKGTGFLGLLKRPDGSGYSSELSIGVDKGELGVGGKGDIEVPTMVPGLTASELKWLLTTPEGQQEGKVPQSIVRKAIDFAKKRLSAGQSPFRQDDEPDLSPTPGAPTGELTAPDPSAPVPATVDQLWSALEHVGEHSRQNQVSPKGARTVAQIMPDTGVAIEKAMGEPGIWKLAQTNTPEGEAAARRMGKFYLQQNLDKFGGDAVKAVAAYNAGPGTKKNAWLLNANLKPEDIPIAETRAYTRRVLDASGVSQAPGGGATNPGDAIAQAATPQHTVFRPRGPSLYDMPGMADQIEKDRYYATKQQEDDSGKRLRALTQESQEEALNATDYLYNKHGTAIFTGGVSQDVLLADLAGQGYRGNVIGITLAGIHADMSAYGGIGNARIDINGDNKANAMATFQLMVDARTKPDDPTIVTRAGQMVARGILKPEEASSIVGANVDAHKANIVNSYAKLQSVTALQLARNARDLVNKAMAGGLMGKMANGPLDMGFVPRFQKELASVMGDYLLTHDGDFAGAEQVGRNWVADFVGRAFPAAAERQRQRRRAILSGANSTASPSGNPLG